MNNDVEEMIKRLSFENWIWVGFIIISALDIYGDEEIKKGLTTHDKEKLNKANQLFLILSYITLLIYIYFFIRNYHDYQKHKTKTYEIRLIGSILFLIGTFCLIYFQKNNTAPTDSPSNI